MAIHLTTLGALRAFRDGVELERLAGTVHTDVHDFTKAIETGDAEAAARLYGGPFLGGVNLVDLQPWEAWVEARRTDDAAGRRCATGPRRAPAG
jgi:hypothetical protein